MLVTLIQGFISRTDSLESDPLPPSSAEVNKDEVKSCDFFNKCTSLIIIVIATTEYSI